MKKLLLVLFVLAPLITKADIFSDVKDTVVDAADKVVKVGKQAVGTVEDAASDALGSVTDYSNTIMQGLSGEIFSLLDTQAQAMVAAKGTEMFEAVKAQTPKKVAELVAAALKEIHDLPGVALLDNVPGVGDLQKKVAKALTNAGNVAAAKFTETIQPLIKPMLDQATTAALGALKANIEANVKAAL